MDSDGSSSRSDALEHAELPRRRVVLHPRTASANRLDRVRSTDSRVRGFQAETTEVMDYVARQRRSALRLFGPMVACVALFYVVIAVNDGPASWRIGSVPILWLLLGPVLLFSMLILAAINERRAVRIERSWISERS